MKDGNGIMALYSAPADSFAGKEAVLGKILESFSLDTTQGSATPLAELELFQVSPVVVPDNPQFKDFPGGVTLQVPKGLAGIPEAG
jgi:hypothetical protein